MTITKNDIWTFKGQTVVDTDMGMRDALGRMNKLTEHFVVAGLFGKAVNRWGERIATYGYTHAGSRGAAPNWVFRARKAADEGVGFRAHRVIESAIQGSPPMAKVLADLGKYAVSAFETEIRSSNLVDTGDLVRAISFATDFEQHAPPTPTRKYRIKRYGGDAALSDRQQLYMLYHRGRSRTMTRMRRGMSYDDFKAKYEATWLAASKAQRVGVRQDIAAHRRAAVAAASSTVPGRFNQSQAKMLHEMIMGAGGRQNQERAAAREKARSDRTAARAAERTAKAAQRAAQREQDRQYVASVRASLSGRRGRR